MTVPFLLNWEDNRKKIKNRIRKEEIFLKCYRESNTIETQGGVTGIKLTMIHPDSLFLAILKHTCVQFLFISKS